MPQTPWSPEALTTLLYETGADGVATVTINRPEAMNAFSIAMIEEFALLWAHVRDDDAVRAVVLRAAPGRAFSTGFDVKGPSPVDGIPNVWNRDDPGERLGPKACGVWKPVICAVHGMCAGGAFYWTNECDIIICSEDATFFDPHVTYGMVAALEPIGLTHRIHFQDVMRMALLGNDERISAATALRIGLVTEITALDALWARAHELAALIAAKPPAAIQGTVRAIWESRDMPPSVALKTALKYTQVGNPIGKAEVNRAEIMGAAKKYTIR
ncbi:MAG: enoyl-CoA hydratase/isomerase family protein [Brevundimonas sp.]|nr:enoyl-CoA hydratase/isomerase family protein [Brevundimonas sp.]